MTKTRVTILVVDGKSDSATSLPVKRYRLARRPIAGLTAAKGQPTETRRSGA